MGKGTRGHSRAVLEEVPPTTRSRHGNCLLGYHDKRPYFINLIRFALCIEIGNFYMTSLRIAIYERLLLVCRLQYDEK